MQNTPNPASLPMVAMSSPTKLNQAQGNKTVRWWWWWWCNIKIYNTIPQNTIWAYNTKYTNKYCRRFQWTIVGMWRNQTADKSPRSNVERWGKQFLRFKQSNFYKIKPVPRSDQRPIIGIKPPKLHNFQDSSNSKFQNFHPRCPTESVAECLSSSVGRWEEK